MVGTRRSEVGYDKTFGLIAKRFREDSEQVTREPLPTRWCSDRASQTERPEAARLSSERAIGSQRACQRRLSPGGTRRAKSTGSLIRSAA